MVVTKGHTYLNKPVALSFAPLYLLGIAHQGCFCGLFQGICTAPATSKMELFVILLNAFQLLTKVTKNLHLRCYGVLDPSLLLCIKILFQILIPNALQIERVIERRSLWKALWIKKVPMTYLKKDPGVCHQNPWKKP